MANKGNCSLPPLRVDALQPEVLITALGFLPDADLLAFVCTCRSFRATVQAQNQYAAESVAAGNADGLVARPVQLPPVAHLVQSVALYEWAQRDFGFSQFDEELCSATARAGSLDLLQLLRQRGCPWTASDICGSAALARPLKNCRTPTIKKNRKRCARKNHEKCSRF